MMSHTDTTLPAKGGACALDFRCSWTTVLFSGVVLGTERRWVGYLDTDMVKGFSAYH